MTPDEFDQKRRELIAMRTKYADRPDVTGRINALLGELQELTTATGQHKTDLDRMITRNLVELGKLTSQ